MKNPEAGEYWWVYYQGEWQPAQCDELGWFLCGLDIAVEVEYVGWQIVVEMES